MPSSTPINVTEALNFWSGLCESQFATFNEYFEARNRAWEVYCAIRDGEPVPPMPDLPLPLPKQDEFEFKGELQ